MKPSLSVVLPVHNVQTTLTSTVEQLLEILPELTDRFEVVLMDDASTDATPEAARELALSYPQVQLLTQSTQLGMAESFRSGVRFTHGDLLLLCSDRPDIDLHEIRKLWDRRKEDGAVWGKTEMMGRLGSLPRPPLSSLATGETALPDLLLVPRRLLTGWTMRGERSDVLAYLRQRGYAVERLEVRASRSSSVAPRPKWSGVRSPTDDMRAGMTRRPNLMSSKLRDRTIGR